jgi:hypothetical protein
MISPPECGKDYLSCNLAADGRAQHRPVGKIGGHTGKMVRADSKLTSWGQFYVHVNIEFPVF